VTKDLGKPKYFLGIEVASQKYSVLLFQRSKARLTDCHNQDPGRPQAEREFFREWRLYSRSKGRPIKLEK